MSFEISEREESFRAPHELRSDFALFCENIADLLDNIHIPKVDVAELVSQGTRLLVEAEMPHYQAPAWTQERQNAADAVEAVNASLKNYQAVPAAAKAPDVPASVINLAGKRQEEQERQIRLKAAKAEVARVRAA